MLQQIVSKNKDLKEQLFNLIVKFITKYFRKIFEQIKSNHNTKIYHILQKQLIETIRKDFLDKHYHKFLKWLKKRNITEQQIDDMLLDIIHNSIKIISKNIEVTNYKLPDFKTFYHKCLKRLARKIYENPKTINNMKNEDFKKDIDDVLQHFIPIDNLYIKDQYTNPKSIKYHYINNSSSESQSSHLPLNNNSTKIFIDSYDKANADTKNLNYISTDISKSSEQHSVKSKHSDVKSINIPKNKKNDNYHNHNNYNHNNYNHNNYNHNNYNKYKNEFNENFFDN